jgi:hypothetical protein
VEFLKAHYSAEVLERVFAPAPSRLERIMNAAERAARGGSSRSQQ